MLIWDKHYFEQFDPLTGTASLDHPHFDEADRILARARRLLDGLPRDAISDLIAQFDSLHIDYFGESYHERLGRKYLLEDTKEDFSTHHPEVIELQDMKATYPLPNTPTQWALLYAIVAIDLVAMGLTTFKDNESLFLASEVVALAESLRSSQIIQSTNARKAVETRHKPKNEIKSEFIDWYRANQNSRLFHSKNQAATQFYKNLPKDKQALFTGEDPARFFTDALRKHLKGSH